LADKITFNHKFQELFNNKDSRYFIITGGRGSSKSFTVTSFLTLLGLEANHRILFTRYTMQSAHLSIIPEFVEKIELLNLENIYQINKTDIKNLANGSEVIFRGIKTSSGNQTAALKSLQGITTWVLDEAEELVDEEIFDKINLSVRQKGFHNRIILILNPTTKEHWIYKRFFESKGVQEGFNGIKDDTCYIHTTYLDNVHNLDESYINSIELMKVRRPEKYQHQIMGGWLQKAEGVIFTNWEIGEFDETIPSVFGQDFGFSTDPTTLIETAIDTKLKKIYVRECFVKQHLTTSEIYELNKEHAGNNLIVGDSAEPRLIHEVKSKGCNIKAVKKGKDSIITGIALLQDYDLIVTENSYNLIKELNNYVWLDKKTKPIDDFNHCIDALRYAVFYQLGSPNKGVYHIR